MKNNMKNKFFIFLIMIALVQPVLSETIIYENITTSGYKYFTIQDNLNLKYVNEYLYDVSINGYYLGSFRKTDKIFYPDGANISIHYNPPVSTDISISLMSTVIKPTLLLFLGFMVTWGFGIILVLIVLNKIYRDYIKRR
jgi:hypothetical protein